MKLKQRVLNLFNTPIPPDTSTADALKLIGRLGRLDLPKVVAGLFLVIEELEKSKPVTKK